MDTPFRRSRRPVLGLTLALLCAAMPDALRAQRDTIFFPANPATRPATTVTRPANPAARPAADSPRVPVRRPPPPGVSVPAPAQEENVAIVPSLIGLTVEDARELLARRKLTLGAMDEMVGPGVPGTVGRQQPAAGARVAPGSAVPVWLVAARVAVMPAIMGLPRDRAERVLRQAGLRVGIVSGTADGPRVRVISHTFHAGERVPAGATVNMSMGVPRVPPPQVAQRDTPRTAPQPQPPPPRVARTDSAGAPAQVARVDSAAVPEVRAMGLPAARQALASAGFAAAFDSAFADSTSWTVAEQTPLPGTLIPTGAPVQLALAPASVLPAPVAAAPAQPPVSTGPRTSPAAPVQRPAPERRWPVMLAIAALLLLIVAAAAARRMRGGKAAAPPPAAVRVRLRTEVQPRTSVQGAPLGNVRLRMKVRSGAPAARVAAPRPLFATKEVAGD